MERSIMKDFYQSDENYVGDGQKHNGGFKMLE